MVASCVPGMGTLSLGIRGFARLSTLSIACRNEARAGPEEDLLLVAGEGLDHLSVLGLDAELDVGLVLGALGGRGAGEAVLGDHLAGT